MFSLTCTLDPQNRVPMYEQIYRRIASAIRCGDLRHGERLPSKLELCHSLGVSRSTVEGAYELLRAEGYVTARPRSGFYVADYVPLQEMEEAPAPPEDRPPEDPGREEALFSTSAVDVSQFPYASWAKLYREVVYNSPELLQRGLPQGEWSLRTALARMASEFRGVRCSPEQVVVGAGVETLLEQLITLFGPEAVYAVEDPGYPAVERSLLARGRAIRYIPLDEGGMETGALERSRATVAYLTPSHQFPLGVTMPASRRSRLLRWAAEGGGYIIEDDYDSEFRYGGRPISSMQGMDRHGRVIYLGTFSRSLAPSIRLAYMVLPPELLGRHRALFGRQQPTVSRYEQTVMARFLEEGFYARYLRRVGSLYAERRQRMLQAFAQAAGIRMSGAAGGIHFLLTVPSRPEGELLALAEAAGLPLRGLSAFCRRVQAPPSTLVVGFGGLPTEQIESAVCRLCAAWDLEQTAKP